MFNFGYYIFKKMFDCFIIFVVNLREDILIFIIDFFKGVFALY